MHLGNSVICPVTGIPMLIAAGGFAVWALKKSKQNFNKENILQIIGISLLIFSLQMLNFAIPQTGSSGHIIGAILLCALLGRHKAFIAMCSILTVQSLFFNDGGLLALGCNIFNMGILPCYVAYPLLYKPLEKQGRPILAAILSSVIALQIGACAVVFEGFISGSITVSNVMKFLGLMQGIHLPIGLIEGIFTALVVFITKKEGFTQKLSFIFCTLSLFIGGVIAQYASTKPDGLEWSLINLSDSFIAQNQGVIFTIFEEIQSKTAVFSNINPIISNISGIIILAVLLLIIYSFMQRKKITN